jgi:dihydrofolate reductase
VRVSAVLAADERDLIGVGDGGLPWHLPTDLRRFKRLTDGHVVVAGRLTHESIVQRLGRPLPGRLTVVVTRRTDLPGVVCQPDVAAALSAARAIAAFAGGDEVFVIGGARVYAAALPFIDRVYLTRVHTYAAGDVYMPEGWLDPFFLADAQKSDDDAIPATYSTYDRA